MEESKKDGRYSRIFSQLEELTSRTTDPLARMASICAVLHHKMPYYFWTGFYLLKEDKLIVGPYQGPLACQELLPPEGVCWAAVKRLEPVVVPDVHAFPGHKACDSRSLSEITSPVFNQNNELVAVFDVDSDKLGQFSECDSRHLEKILNLIYHPVKKETQPA